jgi:crotonobetainyl-CoA:carnitine CoA-transferase CaiB-like acyl-CoA transferase
MAAPLDGIRVIEVSNWLAAPASAALMADLGADVIKVEPPGGDIFRGFSLRSLGFDYDFATNYAFELDNRGKKSVTIDLNKPGGPELVQKLAASCDVFLTNLIQKRAVRYGLTYEDVQRSNPSVVYASLSGYGSDGPDQDRAGFDYSAFWARSGIMGLLGEPDAPPPLCRGGQGDHATALNILAAVLAGLRMKDQTGEGQRVEVTLQATGMWTIAADMSAALVANEQAPRISRDAPTHPVWNSYLCDDDRWVLLVNPVPFPDAWPQFCEMLGKPEWTADERYADIPGLVVNSRELTAAADTVFATRSSVDWGAEMDRRGIIWAPVARTTEVINDPQVREMGWIAEVESEFGTYETLDTPFKVYGTGIGVRGPAPSPGQHTFDVLADYGIDDDELDKLATDGVLG